MRAQARVEGFAPGNGVASARDRAEARPSLLSVVPIGHFNPTPLCGHLRTTRPAPWRQYRLCGGDFQGKPVVQHAGEE
jgi:hypothetical protein